MYPEVFNFSSLNYLVSDSALPFRQYFAVDLKFISKVTIANSNYTQDIFWDDSENNHGFGVASNKWRIWNGAATTGGSAVNNTTYWTQLVEQIGQGTKLYVLEDDGTYTLDTLPDIAQWTLAVSVSTGLFDTTGMKVRIGNGYTTLAEPWRGKIDLSNTCIYTGSQVGDSTSWTVYWKPFRSVSF